MTLIDPSARTIPSGCSGRPFAELRCIGSSGCSGRPFAELRCIGSRRLRCARPRQHRAAALGADPARRAGHPAHSPMIGQAHRQHRGASRVPSSSAWSISVPVTASASRTPTASHAIKATKLRLPALCQGGLGACRQPPCPTCPVPPDANGSTRAAVTPDLSVLTKRVGALTTRPCACDRFATLDPPTAHQGFSAYEEDGED